MGCVFLPLDLLPQKRRLPANPMQALLHLFILSSLAAISWSCFVCRNPLTSLAPDAPVPTARHQQLLLPASSKLWAPSWYHPALPLALSGFHCRRCDANAPEHMVHTNMHGNDWERRHRSVATFLASIMMREKIIWRMVGSIPPSLNDCTSRARPGAARMNAPRRGRPPPPCKGGAATGRGSRRASPYRAGYGGLLPGEVKKAGWLASCWPSGRG